jgi:hypothetical protein
MFDDDLHRLLRWPLWLLIGGTLALAASVAPAVSQDVAPYDDGTRIGFTVHNRMSQPMSSPITVETAAGTVTIMYTTRPGATPGGCCDDAVEVWHVPAGWIAVPASLDIPEGETALIELRRYVGG